MKKIAIFSNDLSVGGIQKSLYNLLRNVDYSKYEIDVYLMKDNNFYQDKLPQEVNIYYLKKHSKFHKILPYSINKHLYKYEGQDKHYDVAIDFDGYQQLTALNALKCNADKKVMWIHSNWVEKRKYEKNFAVALNFSKGKNKYFDQYVGVSQGVIEPFEKINNIKVKNYEIIPNIIDTSEIFEKAKEDCDLKVDSKKYNFCTLGRVSIQKGFDILLEYINELRKIRKDFHLYLIGDGEEMDNIKSSIEKLEIQEYVTLLGLQKNPFKYMKLMDGFVLTSRYEGQGMVLWEAKALGLELFMTKNLEQYNRDLVGYEDIVIALSKAKKKKKKNDDLEKYNEFILNQLEKIFSQ